MAFNDGEYMLQFFKYDHLPEDLQRYSRPFADTAAWIVEALPDNPERTVSLRKLLEAKDCAVRSQLVGKQVLTINISDPEEDANRRVTSDLLREIAIASIILEEVEDVIEHETVTEAPES
jgi:hypothetical protein